VSCQSYQYVCSLQGLGELITWTMLISHYHIILALKLITTVSLSTNKDNGCFQNFTTLLIYTISENTKCLAMGVCTQSKFNLVEQAWMTVLTKLLGKKFLHIHLGLIGTFKCVFHNLHSLTNLQKKLQNKTC